MPALAGITRPGTMLPASDRVTNYASEAPGMQTWRFPYHPDRERFDLEIPALKAQLWSRSISPFSGKDNHERNSEARDTIL